MITNKPKVFIKPDYCCQPKQCPWCYLALSTNRDCYNQDVSDHYNQDVDNHRKEKV